MTEMFDQCEGLTGVLAAAGRAIDNPPTGHREALFTLSGAETRGNASTPICQGNVSVGGRRRKRSSDGNTHTHTHTHTAI